MVNYNRWGVLIYETQYLTQLRLPTSTNMLFWLSAIGRSTLYHPSSYRIKRLSDNKYDLYTDLRQLSCSIYNRIFSSKRLQSHTTVSAIPALG